MTRKVQTNQPLKQNTIRRFRAREEDQQASCGAAVGDHVQHGAEAGRLVEFPRRPAVHCVEEAGDGVEETAAAWMERHEVEGYECQNDSRIT